MSDFSEQVAEKIKQQGIQPAEKWHFTLKHSAVWLGALFCLGLASLAIGVSTELVREGDWDLADRFEGGMVGYAWRTIPHLWILFGIVCTVAAFVYIRHTKHGYRYRTAMIAALLVFTASSLGAGTYYASIAKKTDRALGHFRPYRSLVHRPQDRWMRPPPGMLAGTVVSVAQDRQFTLRDPSGMVWEVRINTSSPMFVSQELTSKRLRLVGQTAPNQFFFAEFFRPWEMR